MDAESTYENTDDRNDRWGALYSYGSGPHYAATNWASKTHPLITQTQRMPEVFVPYVAGAYQPMGTANFSFFSTPEHAFKGARATEDLTPPSYDDIIQMKEIEIRQS